MDSTRGVACSLDSIAARCCLAHTAARLHHLVERHRACEAYCCPRDRMHVRGLSCRRLCLSVGRRCPDAPQLSSLWRYPGPCMLCGICHRMGDRNNTPALGTRETPCARNRRPYRSDGPCLRHRGFVPHVSEHRARPVARKPCTVARHERVLSDGSPIRHRRRPHALPCHTLERGCNRSLTVRGTAHGSIQP